MRCLWRQRLTHRTVRIADSRFRSLPPVRRVWARTVGHTAAACRRHLSKNRIAFRIPRVWQVHVPAAPGDDGLSIGQAWQIRTPIVAEAHAATHPLDVYSGLFPQAPSARPRRIPYRCPSRRRIARTCTQLSAHAHAHAQRRRVIALRRRKRLLRSVAGWRCADAHAARGMARSTDKCRRDRTPSRPPTSAPHTHSLQHRDTKPRTQHVRTHSHTRACARARTHTHTHTHTIAHPGRRCSRTARVCCG